MKSIIEVYHEIARNNPMWTPQEERDAIKRLYNKKDNGKFVNEAFKHNLGLVFNILDKYSFAKNNDDVIQNAAIGLTNALKSYDPKKGIRISTWVYNPIRWSVLKYQDVYSRQGYILDDIMSWNRHNKTKFSVVELDKSIGQNNSNDDDNHTLSDVIGVDIAAVDYVRMRNIKTIDEETRESDIKSAIYDLISGKYGKFLTYKEEFVIRKLTSGMNQSDISKELKVTKMRVSQIVASAYEKIRKSNAGKRLKNLVM